MKKYFLTGLVTLLPLAVTVAIAIFVVNFLTKPFMGLVTPLLGSLLQIKSVNAIRTISQLLILVSLFLFTLGLGFVARWFFFKSMMRTGDRLAQKIPLFNKVYTTARDIIENIFNGDQNSFQQVVMVSFPYPGCYTLGLVIRKAPETCSQAANQEFVSVFLPTTPNPTTGFLIIRPKSDLIYLDMQSEDAIKYIVSCGVVPPESSEAP